MAAALTRTDAVTVRRRAERASYERDAADAILDEGLVAHVGIEVDGQPFVIPMVYGRDGDRLLLHGSVATRLLRSLDTGVRVCATVTLIDALVVARSQFHHSMDYRSVVVLGTARRIRDADAAKRALACIVDHVVPGRAVEARPPSDAEVRQTAVVELPIDTASVKVRSHGVADEPEDLDLDVWAGVIPVQTTFGEPVPAEDLRTDIGRPRSVSPYRRP